VIASPLRPRHDRYRASPPGAGSPTPRNALRRFTFVRHHNASMASFRPALTEAPQRKQPHWDRPVNSGPRPCLFDVGFPLSGLQDRTHTSDLNTRAQHTRHRVGLRPPLRRARPFPPPPAAFSQPNPHTSTSPQRRRQRLTNAANTLKTMDSLGQQKERCSWRYPLPRTCAKSSCLGRDLR